MGTLGGKGLRKHIFSIYLIVSSVPEGDACFRSVGSGVGVHDGFGEETPAVVGPDVGKIDEGIHCQGNP